jgi:hypothetical protein
MSGVLSTVSVGRSGYANGSHHMAAVDGWELGLGARGVRHG